MKLNEDLSVIVLWIKWSNHKSINIFLDRSEEKRNFTKK